MLFSKNFFYKTKVIYIQPILFFIGLIFHSGYIFAQTPENAIRTVLAEQQTAWNEGDLIQFMQGYWQSDSLRFIGSNGVQYGWQTTLENYQRAYPDKEAMGILKFDVLSIEPLGKDFYFVIGKWHLTRKKGNLEGHFSLIWRNIEGQWRIIADHSS